MFMSDMKGFSQSNEAWHTLSANNTVWTCSRHTCTHTNTHTHTQVWFPLFVCRKCLLFLPGIVSLSHNLTLSVSNREKLFRKLLFLVSMCMPAYLLDTLLYCLSTLH